MCLHLLQPSELHRSLLAQLLRQLVLTHCCRRPPACLPCTSPAAYSITGAAAMQTIARYFGSKPNKEWQLVLVMGAIELFFSQASRAGIVCSATACSCAGGHATRRQGGRVGLRPAAHSIPLLPRPPPAQLPSLEGAC